MDQSLSLEESKYIDETHFLFQEGRRKGLLEAGEMLQKTLGEIDNEV